MAWFNDRQIVSHLPLQFRFYAAYARAVGNARTGSVKGGTALHRQLAATSSLDVELLRAYLVAGDTFLDIGANHGAFACFRNPQARMG